MDVIDLTREDVLEIPAEFGIPADQLTPHMRNARVAIDDGRLKFSINRSVWTFGVGQVSA